MKSKTLFGALLGLSLAMGASASGCFKRDRTQPPPPVELGAPPRPTEKIEASPEKIRATLAESVHKKVDCTGCHAAVENRKNPDEVGKGQCTSCHQLEAKAYAETIHAKAAKDGKEAALCEDCHGMHDVRPAGDEKSLINVRNIPRTCGKCHENPKVAKDLGIKKPLATRQYIESIHGRSLLVQGLTVAPSCADCHGKAHSIFEEKDPRSSVNIANVAKTCGRCHAGELEKYRNSIHAVALQDQLAGKPHEPSENVAKDKKPPTCPTCHTAHEIKEKGPHFRLVADKICGDCHQDRLARYLDTYHGRAHHLGDQDVAACHSCHGSHDVWPSSNSASTLFKEKKQATCQTCHPGVSQNFANYLAHADHGDKKNYPKLYWAFIGMTGLLVGTFGFFGIHSLLWLIRVLIVRAQDPKGFKEAKDKARDEHDARLYLRFRPIDRFVHFLVIVSFMLLVITGMPIKFHTEKWAQFIFDAMGGAPVARSVHRFAAIITLSYFVLHIWSLVSLARKKRAAYTDENGKVSGRRLLAFVFGPDSPMPRLQDAKDIVANMKWFVGRGPRPKFDRFTYWEKFDYIAVFWGVTVIGLSGLIMWLPDVFTKVLPGWVINIAHIVHSDEALLAAGFIFTFHFFNSHFRPEKFPYDQVMFAGYITEEELKHERPAQYERMKAAGELDKFRTLGEWEKWKPIVNTFGTIAIIVGLSLSAMIFWALLK